MGCMCRRNQKTQVQNGRYKFTYGYLEVSKFIHELELEMMMNQRDEKRKKIEEFDTMVSFKNYKNNTQK